MNPSPQICAAELLEVVPLIMRVLRTEVRRHRTPELSIPQFRALAFLGRNPGAALADLAAFLGLTPPSASKLIDGLLAEGFVVRASSQADRRRVHLALSETGRVRYQMILKQAREFLAGKISHLGGAECTRLLSAMRTLRAVFEHEAGPELGSRSRAKKTQIHARTRS